MASRRVSCLLLLGGNLGDRKKRLRDALRGLSRLPGTRLLKVSRLYETAPVGPSRRRYLNCAAAIETTLSPMGLLVECKRLEAEAGRKPGRRWAARPLDVDLVRYGRLKVETPWLTLPHPRMRERAFAAAPLADLAPDFRPILRRLNPDEQTVKIVADGIQGR